MSRRSPRVFISGNSEEFAEHRRVVSEACLSRGWMPVAQDHFATMHGQLTLRLRESIESCDAVICLVGRGYGAEPPQVNPRRSYTQLEFDFAQAAKLPVFVMSRQGGAVAQGAEEEKLQQDFVQQIQKLGLLWHDFTSMEELKSKVLGIRELTLKPPARQKMLLAAGLAAALVVAGLTLSGGKKQIDYNPVKTDTPGRPPESVGNNHTTANERRNSLGMMFVPVVVGAGKRLWFSQWETRVQDWKAFIKAKNASYSSSAETDGDAQPVTQVTLPGMAAFCEWLTSQERKEGKLPQGAVYRIPTLVEWRAAAGVPAGATHAVYAWGQAAGVGNQAVANFAGKESTAGNPQLPDDHFIKTAPVGSFPPNQAGLYDLAGNVGEVCAVPEGRPVICGGDWQDQDFARMNLAVTRPYDMTEDVSETVGFRCVLELPAEP